MKRTTVAATLLMFAGGTGIYACSDRTQPQARAQQDLFAFAEVDEMAHPIATMTPQTKGATIAQLRQDAPQVARVYLEALTRFDGTYGEGVGPAKRESGYLECKSVFHQVAARIGSLPVTDSPEQLASLWSTLQACSMRARRWSDPAEMATFGKDLQDMTHGSMLVLSIAATASGSNMGPQFHAEQQRDRHDRTQAW